MNSGVCPRCDGYGVIAERLIVVRCDHPGCPGHVSHAEALSAAAEPVGA